jgi:hypothetical protein
MNEMIEILNGLGLELKETTKGEYHGPCPFCKEGEDRFWVTPEPLKSDVGLYYCRRCKGGGNVNKLIKFLGGDPPSKPKKNGWARPSPANILSRIIKQPPLEQWQEKMIPLLNRSQGRIGDEEPYRRRGLNEKTIKDLRLGYNAGKCAVKIGEEKIAFPHGMLIPNFRGDVLYSIQVRAWPEGTGYKYCKGSVPVPYHFTKLDDKKAPVIIVESALDAAAIFQEAGDLVQAVALGSAQAKPDIYLSDILYDAARIFLCLDYDDAGFEAVKWWKSKYPNIRIGYCPRGKDIGDYQLSGGALRPWVETLIETGSFTPRPEPDIEISTITESADAENLLNAIKENGLVPGTHITENYLALALEDQAWAIDLKAVPMSSLALLSDIAVIAHDGVDLIEKLAKKNLHCRHVESTRLQLFTIIGMLWDLDKLAQFRLGYSGAGYKEEYTQTALNAHCCHEIYNIQDQKIQNRSLVKAYQLFAQAQPAVAEIRTTGFCFDMEYHKSLVAEWKEKAEQYPDSTIKHRLSTFGEKYAETYVKAKTGRIYPDFQLTESPTARFISPNPNLLGIPKDNLRRAFCAPEGKLLIGADFSQIDLRTAAMLTGDEKMIEAFRAGIDLHVLTAAAMYNISPEDVTDAQRKSAKSVNYAMMYGGSSGQSHDALKRMHAMFPKFHGWLGRQAANFRKHNSVKTPCGREILRNSMFSDWSKQVRNYPIQGGSSEVLLAAMHRVKTALENLDARLVLCIHDEIILEVAEQDAEAVGNALVSAMVEGFLDVFPEGPVDGLVKVEKGRTWFDIS